MADRSPRGDTADPIAPVPDLPVVDFRQVLETFSDAVVAADMGNRIVYANRAAGALLGYAEDDLTGRPLTTIMPERLRARHQAGFERFLATRQPQLIGLPVRVPALRSDGSEVEIELTLSVFDGEPDLPLFVGALRDIAHRIELEKQIAISKYLTAAAEVASLLTAAPSLDVAAAGVLPVMCAHLDWDVAELWMQDEGVLVCQHSWHADHVHAPLFAALSRSIRFPRLVGVPGRVLERGEAIAIPDVTVDPNFPRAPAARAEGLHGALAFPIVGRRGVLGVIEFFSSEVRQSSAELVQVASTIGRHLGQFIERKLAEDDLRAKAALLESQSEATIDGVLVISPTGEVLSMNRRFVEMWDIDPAAVAGKAAVDVAVALSEKIGDTGASIARLVRLAGDQTLADQEEVVLRDGRVFDRYTAPVIADDGALYGRAWYFRDITDRKRIEWALAESRERFAMAARTLQRSLLPPHLPEIDGLDLAAVYEAAGEGLDVGGDFYDVFAMGDDDWAFVVGDVCGKGPRAAAVTALARYTIRAAATRLGRPSSWLSRLNEVMLRHDAEQPFCSVACLRVRRGGLDDESEEEPGSRTYVTLASGGHPLPLLLRHSGEVVELGSHGTLLGLFESPELSDTSAALEPGDTLICYTDGLTEAQSPDGTLFGEARVVAVLEQCRGQSASEVVERLAAAARAHAGGPTRDDLAVLAIKLVAP